jgi:hypothetical protein
MKFAMMTDGSAGNPRLKPQFVGQLDIIDVLQIELDRSKTLIGWNEVESTIWMLLHFSAKSKE